MPVTINGSGGITSNDGSAAAPPIAGTDSNTGIFFPAADTIAFAEGGAEVARIDSSGNLLVGATSNTDQSGTFGQTIRGPAPGLTFVGTEASARTYTIYEDTGSLRIYDRNATAERARIDSSGNLLVGTTSTSGVQLATSGGLVTNGTENFWMSRSAGGGSTMNVGRTSGAGTGNLVEWTYNGATRGTVTTNGTNVAYNTSSDYRLKHDIQPMVGALAKVALLKPCTYKWNADNSNGEGFIAHELQAVFPDAVTGEKDAVDAEGNPVYQGIDTSFLVATLTAAIQELKAELDTAKARIAALEGAQA